MMNLQTQGLGLALLLALAAGFSAAGAEPAAPRDVITPAMCAALASTALPDTAIESAVVVNGPSFTPPGGTALANLPAFCRLIASAKPSIRFEVWLPLNGWNGKFQGVGNGGTAGIISYAAMATA